MEFRSNGIENETMGEADHITNLIDANVAEFFSIDVQPKPGGSVECGCPSARTFKHQMNTIVNVCHHRMITIRLPTPILKPGLSSFGGSLTKGVRASGDKIMQSGSRFPFSSFSDATVDLLHKV